MDCLSVEEINERVNLLIPSWRYTGISIEREFDCKDFKQAVRFMTFVAAIAENHILLPIGLNYIIKYQ